MAKTITSITLIFCLLTVSLTLEARQVVTGQITDRYDGTPIPGAAVFIARTTTGTQTDRYGNFSITAPIQGSFEIVVSHIGFEPAFHSIDTPQSSHRINFALRERINLLEEVVVSPCIPHSRRDIDFFWRTILGENPSNRGMQVLNPEVVQFCLIANDILRAFADEPIEIVNHNMGYHISYILIDFKHDYRNEITRVSGVPFFTELTPQNNRQNNRWERRRQEVYSVSLTRFIRALYQEQLYKNGFFLAKREQMEQTIIAKLALSREDTVRLRIPIPEQRGVVTTVETFSINHILHRDEKAGTRVNIEQSVLVAFLSRPVTYMMLRDPDRTFFSRHVRHPIIRLLPLDITIFADGSYLGMLNIREYRNSVLGLRAMLPMEFGLSEGTP